MKFGLVTYLWGRDWELPTLIANLEATGVLGVELRVEHAHGVSTDLTAEERTEVKERFAASPVELVGMGCNWEFHSPDTDELRANIEGAKAYVRLSGDCGGSGVKVKPNTLPDGIPEEQTIEQIGNSLNEVGAYAADFGQQIRVEVHGRHTQRLPVMKRIFDVATHPNVTVCWNCNQQDLEGQGLEHNFNLVKDRFGDTVHVRELDDPDYPYRDLVGLLVDMEYAGWILLEARTEPADRVQALRDQKALFEEMRTAAQV